METINLQRYHHLLVFRTHQYRSTLDFAFIWVPGEQRGNHWNDDLDKISTLLITQATPCVPSTGKDKISASEAKELIQHMVPGHSLGELL